MEIKNKQGEKLETRIEGAKIENAKQILLMVHGLGTSLSERGLFDDIVRTLTAYYPNICTIRFSWPGYGESEGKQEETDLYKVADCIKIFLDYIVENKNPHAKVTLLAHSMGNPALVYTLKDTDYPIDLYIAECPSVYRKGSDVLEKWKKRPNTIIDDNGVLITPRADGTISRIGQCYWDSIDPEAYSKYYPGIVKKYNSVLVRALEDPIVDNSVLKELSYNKILELHGDHSFKNPEDRKVYINKLIELLG